MAKERPRALQVSLKREMAKGHAFPSLQEETLISSCDAASGLKSTPGPTWNYILNSQQLGVGAGSTFPFNHVNWKP